MKPVPPDEKEDIRAANRRILRRVGMVLGAIAMLAFLAYVALAVVSGWQLGTFD